MRTTPTAVPGAGPERGVAPYFLRLDVAWWHHPWYSVVRRRDGRVVERFTMARSHWARRLLESLNENAREGILE